MKKLAVFTEGQTEQIFLKKFIEEIGGVKNILFDIRSVSGDNSITRMQSKEVADEQSKYRVLLYDCRSDERVKSEILDQLESLTRAGYHLILGVRDLYPRPLSEIESVKLNLKARVPTAGIPIHILLAVSEIESWFLQEEAHFNKIDPRLDLRDFKEKFGFDPRMESAEEIEHPAELLHKIYASVGKAYRKTRSHVGRTVDVLDYASLYFDKATTLPHLQEFIGRLDDFLGATPLHK